MKLKLGSKFDIENYLEYQGKKFVDRFDANSYIYIMRAIDLYDGAEGYESLKKSFERIKCKKVFVCSFTSDWLFPTYQSEEIVRALKFNKVDVEYEEIDSPYGHDSFLLEYKELTQYIKQFFASL